MMGGSEDVRNSTEDCKAMRSLNRVRCGISQVIEGIILSLPHDSRMPGTGR